MLKPALAFVALAAVLAALAAVAACGDVTEPVGCDFRGGGVNGPEDRCQERRNFQATSFAPACEGLGGAVVEGGCPRDGVVAGCDLGTDVIDFYYEPLTRDDVVDECGSDTVVDADF